MPSRQLVLLTPLESSHPQPSPSSHRINLMNIDFPVVDPLYFQTFTGVHFATHLFSCSCRNGGGYTPLPNPDVPMFGRLDVQTICKFFTCNTYDPPRKCCNQMTYSQTKPFSCNIYRKPGGRGQNSEFLKWNFNYLAISLTRHAMQTTNSNSPAKTEPITVPAATSLTANHRRRPYSFPTNN
jgi:hypothetical protein